MEQDRGRLARRAKLLLVAVAATVGLTAGVLAMFIVAFAQAGEAHLRVEPVSLGVGLIVGVGLAVRVVQVARSTRGAVRIRRTERRARRATPAVRNRVEVLALATGQRPPELFVLPDETVNAASAGAPGNAAIMITSGACALPPTELDALLAFCFAQLASNELRIVRDTSAAVSLYARVTQMMWALIIAGVIIGELSQAGGPWLAVTGLATIGWLVGVVGGIAATAAVLGLVRAAGALADSDAIRETMRPDAYARLLVRMLTDDRETNSTLAPLLWMEHATTRTDLAAMAGSFHSQQDLEYRTRRMCAIAGITPPTHQTTTLRLR